MELMMECVSGEEIQAITYTTDLGELGHLVRLSNIIRNDKLHFEIKTTVNATAYSGAVISSLYDFGTSTLEYLEEPDPDVDYEVNEDYEFQIDITFESVEIRVVNPYTGNTEARTCSISIEDIEKIIDMNVADAARYITDESETHLIQSYAKYLLEGE
jgi:hypothetical protein